MKPKFSTSGLDELSKKIDDISEKSKELSGTHDIPLGDIFTDNFMSRNTSFGSLEEFFNATTWDVSSGEALKAVPDEEADAFVQEHSSYSTWDDMFNAAMKEYLIKRLGL